MTKTTTPWNIVWERARAGAHTMVIGQEPAPLAPGDLQMLWICCEMIWSTQGPLSEALRRIEKLLGEDVTHAAQVPEPHGGGLSERLFDDPSAPSMDTRFVDACNRLAAWTGCNVVLGFQSLDVADEATVTTLTQILRHPGWLRLPIVVTVQHRTQGPVSELIDVMQCVGGEGAVIEMHVQRQPLEPSPSFDWATLPLEVLRVLRAGAVMGREFQADLVARLLDEPLGAVLEKLQQAVDAGVALVDRGDGRFALPAEAIGALQAHMLPSLLSFWHAQVGALLSGEPPPSRETSPPEPPSAPSFREPGINAPIRIEMDDDQAPLFNVPEDACMQTSSEQHPAEDYAGMFESELTPEVPSHVSLALEDSTDDMPEPKTAPAQAARDERGESQPEMDPGRAAEHLQAAGQTEAAVAQYLAAMHKVAARGDARRAEIIAQQALRLLDRLPPSTPRMLLRAQLFLVLGKVQWQSATLGAHYTLQDALTSLDAAKASLPDTAPLEVAGQLAAITAGVCYDLGALESLQHALGELNTVSRRLLEAGMPMQAACLLNDQAAVYVRLGDPVRATHLLMKSRELFEALLRSMPEDVTVVRELAATEHLLARLPLHTQIRPGHAADAYAISLNYALAAESAYERLQQPRELARVWETIGRLELGRGRLDAAEGRLMTALRLQKQMGDVTGLARTTGALAEMCMAGNRLHDAARLLADSVALNAEKGSPIGLAFNRRAFDALQQVVNQMQTSETGTLLGVLEDVERQLTQAEKRFGRLTLPGERYARH